MTSCKLSERWIEKHERSLTAKPKGQQNDTNIPSLYLTSLAFLKTILDTVTIVSGKGCTIIGSNSEVILHVPDGVFGLLLAKIHTKHSKFLRQIPDKDCLVSPICEYILKPFIGSSYRPPVGSKYKIQIPHTIRNVHEVRKHLKVRHGNIHKEFPLDVESVLYSNKPLGNTSCSIDDKYVTVVTDHFSGFIVTAENIDCCSDCAIVLVFGALKNIRTAKPAVDLKVYFASKLAEISDYRHPLIKREQLAKRDIVEIAEINLSNNTYDASQSKVTLELKPRDRARRQPLSGHYLVEQRELHETLKYTDGHTCKGCQWKQAAAFNLESCDEYSPYFEGILNVGIDIALEPRVPFSLKTLLYQWIFGDKYDSKQSLKVCLSDKANAIVDSRTEMELPTSTISKLASIVSKNNMTRIALEFLGYQFEQVENTSNSDAYYFNVSILHGWKLRNHDNCREELREILRKAAQEGLLDYNKVAKILGDR